MEEGADEEFLGLAAVGGLRSKAKACPASSGGPIFLKRR